MSNIVLVLWSSIMQHKIVSSKDKWYRKGAHEDIILMVIKLFPVSLSKRSEVGGFMRVSHSDKDWGPARLMTARSLSRTANKLTQGS